MASILAPKWTWRVISARSSSVRGPGLSRICCGIATLPRSCSGAARRRSETKDRGRPSTSARRAASGADALGVLVGVVVVVLRHRGEDGEALHPRLLELDGASADGLVEILGAPLGGELEVTGEQVGADAEQQLDLVDRLGQEVAGAAARQS